jgi:hypothetical protein
MGPEILALQVLTRPISSASSSLSSRTIAGDFVELRQLRRAPAPLARHQLERRAAGGCAPRRRLQHALGTNRRREPCGASGAKSLRGWKRPGAMSPTGMVRCPRCACRRRGGALPAAPTAPPQPLRLSADITRRPRERSGGSSSPRSLPQAHASANLLDRVRFSGVGWGLPRGAQTECRRSSR